MMPGMVEYGQGVGQATGVAGGGGGGGGQTMDAGAAIGQFVPIDAGDYRMFHTELFDGFPNVTRFVRV